MARDLNGHEIESARNQDIDNLRLRAEIQAVREQLEFSRQERHDLESAFRKLEPRVHDLEQKVVELEQNEMMSGSLHVAMERLSEESSREGIITALQEIVANLVGSEEIALYELDPETNALLLTAACGADPPERIAPGDGVIGRVFATGERYLEPIPAKPSGHAEHSKMSLCLPLLRRGAARGALVVYGLLPQKNRLDANDLEVMNFLEKWLLSALGEPGRDGYGR